jgi:hypothetical protein
LNDAAALRVIVQQQRQIIDSMEEAHNFDAFQVKRGALRQQQQQPKETSEQRGDEDVCVRQWLRSILKRRYP